MGQKSNPNSFQQQYEKAPLWSSHNQTDYSILLKNNFEITQVIHSIFERHGCLIKECTFLRSKEVNSSTLFISFLPIRMQRKTSKTKGRGLSGAAALANHLFNILNNFGYSLQKRIVFFNLEKIGLKIKKDLHKIETINRLFLPFKQEPFYNSGLMIFYLLFSIRNMTPLLSKYIAKYFKLLHRTRKINKFLLFLTRFVELTGNVSFNNLKVKGLKIQIKGRFNGAPRSKKRVFEKGRVPLQTVSSKINYSLTHINTSYGVFSVKVWIYE
jgi:hypothetical protein